MALEMRNRCEKCSKELHYHSIAYICTHECTFCEACTESMNHVCPNCGGELVRRPKKVGQLSS
ncbi:DUF1272 domain-containing protein [Paenibacillus taihuensis]|uniref:DUF1272 domain-containing protein n=1 Tax=Paenibacillus taihuensis TaxID=1156355 RepID=UPI000E268567|nr:DUF1272 domain-containing protein [Paenibacillus taihuensis]